MKNKNTCRNQIFFIYGDGRAKVNLYINISPAPAVPKNMLLRAARRVAPGFSRAVRVKI